MDNVLLIVSLILILLAFSFGQTGTTYRCVSVISCFTIGGILLICFFFCNAKSKYPTIPMEIMTKKNILVPFFNFSLCYSTMMLAMQYLSIYFQNIEGHNAMHTGLSMIPISVSTSLASLASGISTTTFGYMKPIIVASGLLQPVSIGLLQLLPDHRNAGMDIGFQILLGVTTGMNYQTNMVSAIVEAPQTPSGSLLTTAFMNFGRSVGTALFSEIAGSIYTASLKAKIAHIELQEDTYPIQDIVIDISLLRRLNDHDQGVIKKVILICIKRVFWLGVATSVTAFIFSIFMTNKRMPKEGRRF